ncbi:MAG TPA: DUF4910 domain-containing protein [Acetobacteraceae bacterium]|nr:DUF4910 domain-containing protein [Acetobacteraceae bacterium]
MNRIGDALHAHCSALFPICRSITGEGLRRTLRYVAERIPLQLREVPTGTRVLDWEIPREWNPRAAWIRTLSGETVVDFAQHNLHLVQYSHAVPERTVPMGELRPHLHSLPERPHLIPYRTAYYADSWGFCLPHRVLEGMADPAYRVFIDAELGPGALTYGECLLPGREEGEVLVSAHACHPSLANDNLSGLACALELARWLAGRPRRFTWRFLFAPGTIGALAWLAANRDGAARRVRHGMVLSNLGDGAPLTWKRSRREDAPIDRMVAHVLRHEAPDNRLLPFSPYGYDERQYCSPGFDLPVGCLQRSVHGTFPEYHTSADDLAFVRPEHLARSFAALCTIAEVVERDETLASTCPLGEPQLGRRGLYAAIGGIGPGGSARGFGQMTLLWVLNLADGRHTLLDMAERAGQPFAAVRAAADAAMAVGLLVPAAAPDHLETNRSAIDTLG